jgi:hypothetical protein
VAHSDSAGEQRAQEAAAEIAVLRAELTEQTERAERLAHTVCGRPVVFRVSLPPAYVDRVQLVQVKSDAAAVRELQAADAARTTELQRLRVRRLL